MDQGLCRWTHPYPDPSRTCRYGCAGVIEVDEDGWRTTEWKHLRSVALYQRFLSDPGYFLPG